MVGCKAEEGFVPAPKRVSRPLYTEVFMPFERIFAAEAMPLAPCIGRALFLD